MVDQDRKKASFVVEFVGASGVGKSFLHAALSESLKGRGIVTHDLDTVRIRKLHPATMFLTAKLALLVYRARPVSVSLYVRMVMRLARYAIRRRAVIRIEGVHLCGEGMFHRMRQLYRATTGCTMKQISEMVFRNVQPPEAVIVVEASIKTIFERRVARGRPGDSFSVDTVSSDVRLVQDSISAIEHVRQNISPELYVIRVNIDEPGAIESVDRIASLLCRKLAKYC